MPVAFAQESTTNPEDELLAASLDELLAMPIEVTSTLPETIFNTPSTVSVIDRNMIELYGFSRVSEALLHLAGVDVARTYIKRQLPTIRGVLQDLYANKVLILIDGTPSWMAVTGEGNIDRIDIHDVERIEVLKGPASVLYGTNAYSGAINLVLRKGASKVVGEATRVSAHATAGNRYRLGGGASLHYQTENLTLFVAANSMDERGRLTTYVDENEVSGHIQEYLDGSNFSLGAEYRGFFGRHSLLFNGYDVHESYLGITNTLASGAGRDHEVGGYLARYQFTLSPLKDLDLTAGYAFDWNRRNTPRLMNDTMRSNIMGYRSTPYVRGAYKVASWLSLDAGVDYDYRRSLEYNVYNPYTLAVSDENEMTNRHVTETSVFLQAKVDAEPLVAAFPLPLSLIIGARYTANELFDNNVSLRGTVLYRISDHSSVKLVAAQAYRAPTLFEQYFTTLQRTVQGSPDLDPETSNSIELSYLVGSRTFFAQALVYYATYEDKIYRVRQEPENPANTTLVYVNGPAFGAFGGELEVRYQDPNVVNVFATYAYVNGNNGDEIAGSGHYNFRYVPQHTASLGVSKSLGAFGAATTLRLIGPRQGPEADIAAQLLWNVTATYTTASTTHRLTVENALDHQQQYPEYVRRNMNAVPSGFGRSIFYTLEHGF